MAAVKASAAIGQPDAEYNGYPLHHSVFMGDIRRVSALLRNNDVGIKDKHGNTPLHLAVMLGHKEIVQLLLAHNAPVKVKNAQGWSPLAEGISFGDRQIIKSLLKKLKQQSRESLEERQPHLVAALRKMGDFYLELKWDFQSWIPLVSRMLPSDICKIYKKGSRLRMDTTLLDFSDMKWQRGDLSFVFDGEAHHTDKSLTVMDNVAKCFQRVAYNESDTQVEEEVDLLMCSDIVTAQMSTKPITFTRAQSGWLFREDRTESIGIYEADFYDINGIILETKKRREHLTEEDLQKNKAMVESLAKGNTGLIDASDLEIPRRPSLAPPIIARKWSWEEYISHSSSSSSCSSSAGPAGAAAAAHHQHHHQQAPLLARRLVCKDSSKTFKATVAMSKDFPLSTDLVLGLLEMVAPFKHFAKLREFMQEKLPPGFPIKIDIPIFPTITAKITFQKFHFDRDIPEELFEIPADFTEDRNHFQDL